MHYSIADFILDIVQNSIEADSQVVTVDLLESGSTLAVCIGDDGKGMSEDVLKKVKDPFYTDGTKHAGRKVGLGIPFLIQAVESVGGEFDIKSMPGIGTSVYFTFDLSNIDCPPVGELPSTFVSLMNFDSVYELLVHRKKDERSYRVSRSELVDALGNLSDAESLNLAKKFFISQEDDLNQTEA